jgi:hypothetical protein
MNSTKLMVATMSSRTSNILTYSQVKPINWSWSSYPSHESRRFMPAFQALLGIKVHESLGSDYLRTQASMGDIHAAMACHCLRDPELNATILTIEGGVEDEH